VARKSQNVLCCNSEGENNVHRLRNRNKRRRNTQVIYAGSMPSAAASGPAVSAQYICSDSTAKTSDSRKG
jgi:hypothetical protein